MLVAREQTRNSLQKTHVVPGCTYIGIWDVVFFLYTKTYTVAKIKPGTISLKQTNKYDARDTSTYQEPCRVWRRTTSLFFCNKISMGFAQLALLRLVHSSRHSEKFLALWRLLLYLAAAEVTDCFVYKHAVTRTRCRQMAPRNRQRAPLPPETPCTAWTYRRNRHDFSYRPTQHPPGRKSLTQTSSVPSAHISPKPTEYASLLEVASSNIPVTPAHQPNQRLWSRWGIMSKSFVPPYKDPRAKRLK